MKALVKSFTELGFKPENRTLASFQDDYGLAPLDGEDDVDDDDEDDDIDDDDDDDEDMDDESEGELEGATICVPRG